MCKTRLENKVGSDSVSLADDDVGEARSGTGGGINELKCNKNDGKSWGFPRSLVGGRALIREKEDGR